MFKFDFLISINKKMNYTIPFRSKFFQEYFQCQESNYQLTVLNENDFYDINIPKPEDLLILCNQFESECKYNQRIKWPKQITETIRLYLYSPVLDFLNEYNGRKLNFELFRQACEINDMETITWFIEKFIPIRKNILSDTESCYGGFRGFGGRKYSIHIIFKDIKLVQLLLDTELNNNGIITIFMGSCRYGYLSIIESLKDKILNVINNKILIDGYELCSYDGHFEIMKWLYKNINILEYSEDFKHIIVNSCMIGRLDIITWILDKWPMLKTCPIDCYTSFVVACRNGHINIAKWIIKNYLNLEYDTLNEGFKEACKNGHLNIVKWIKDIFLEINYNTLNKAFREACKHGHLSIVKWLTENWPNIDHRALDDYAFCQACGHGHIETAKWLIKNWPEMNVQVNTYHAFYNACDHGNLHVAKWLIEQYPNVNYKNYANSAFQAACASGHLHVVKWLIKKWPDIDYQINDYNPFRLALESEQIHIVEWLRKNFIKPCSIDVFDKVLGRAIRLNRKKIKKWVEEILL